MATGEVPAQTSGDAAAGHAPPNGAVPVVTDDRHRLHHPSYELNGGRTVTPPESPERLDALVTAVASAGHELTTPVAHPDDAVLAVHDAGMVRFLREGHAAWVAAGGAEVMIPDTFPSPRWAEGGRRSDAPLGVPGWWCFDTATPIVAGSWTAARAGVDVALTAAGLVRDGAPVAYALTRPPGHHAGPDYLGGFCLLNPAAITARSLTDGGHVAVLDLDVHHGNGTQDVFWRDPAVLYASVHGGPQHLYPFFSGFDDEVGAGPGRGTTRNLPLPAGTGDAGWTAAVEVAVDAVAAHRPATLVVSLGFDAAEPDPIGDLAVSRAGYHRAGELVAELATPTVLVQEGGYAVDALGGLVASFLAGVTGRPLEP